MSGRPPSSAEISPKRIEFAHRWPIAACCSRTIRPERDGRRNEMNGPALKTALPGPRAKALIERDAKVVSTSYTRDYPLVIARGEGALVEDVDGNVFLDVTAAIVEQSQKFLHMSGTDFY